MLRSFHRQRDNTSIPTRNPSLRALRRNVTIPWEPHIKQAPLPPLLHRRRSHNEPCPTRPPAHKRRLPRIQASKRRRRRTRMRKMARGVRFRECRLRRDSEDQQRRPRPYQGTRMLRLVNRMGTRIRRLIPVISRIRGTRSILDTLSTGCKGTHRARGRCRS